MKPYLLYTIQAGPLQANCYLLADAASLQSFIIDPGGDPEKIVRIIHDHKLKPSAIVNTHGHYDHIGANAYLKKLYGVPLYIHRDDAEFLKKAELNASAFTGDVISSPAADRELKDGDILTLGALSITVIHTPGHTPGCICLSVKDLLFTGDTLFCGAIGRTDLAGGDDEAMEHSLRVFSTLPPETVILPGHGPTCTIGGELKHNPYLRAT